MAAQPAVSSRNSGKRPPERKQIIRQLEINSDGFGDGKPPVELCVDRLSLVQSAAKNSISPTQSLVSLKTMDSQENENGFNALSCNINGEKLDVAWLGEILLQTLVPTSFGLMDDSREWKNYCDDSGVSVQLGNPIHLCAAKYARDGIKSLCFLESLRKVFDESIWNTWLLSKHNDMIPAVTYLHSCKHQSDFHIEVFKAFLPKPFRAKESAKKGFHVPQLLRLKKEVTETKPDADEEREDEREEKKDDHPDILSAEQFWLERALGIEKRTVLHLCVHIAEEEVIDPEVAILPVQELLPNDIFNQMCKVKCKFGGNALSHWCCFCKSEDELSVDNLKIFMPREMNTAAHNTFFVKNCTSFNGRNLIMKLASVCSKINIPLLPIMNKWRFFLGEDVFESLLKMRTQSGMYTCLFVADCGREDDYEYFIPEMEALLPPYLKLNIVDFLLQMPKVERAMKKDFLDLFKRHLGWRSSELNKILMTHTMTVSGNTFLMEYVMNVIGGYTDFEEDIFKFWTPDFTINSDDDHETYWIKGNNDWVNVVQMAEISHYRQKDCISIVDMSPLMKQLMCDESLWYELFCDNSPYFSEFVECTRLIKLKEADRVAEQLKKLLGLKTLEESHKLLAAANGDLDVAIDVYLANHDQD